MTRPAAWAYVDTSLLAQRYLAAPHAPAARRLLGKYRLVTSVLTHVELASALAQRAAAGQISASARDAALRRLNDDRRFWDSMAVTDEVLAMAGRVVLQTSVRTLDAIHLASALLRRDADSAPLTFLTRDARQARAARELGLAVIGVP